MKGWPSLIIPFCIQLPCLIVQLVYMRKSMRLSRKQLNESPWWLIENSKLWRINRRCCEWIRAVHPELYEDFASACLTDEDFKLLQLRKEFSDEGKNDNRG